MLIKTGYYYFITRGLTPKASSNEIVLYIGNNSWLIPRCLHGQEVETSFFGKPYALPEVHQPLSALKHLSLDVFRLVLNWQGIDIPACV